VVDVPGGADDDMLGGVHDWYLDARGMLADRASQGQTR
jgi:hypothetical protein